MSYLVAVTGTVSRLLHGRPRDRARQSILGAWTSWSATYTTELDALQ